MRRTFNEFLGSIPFFKRFAKKNSYSTKEEILQISEKIRSLNPRITSGEEYHSHIELLLKGYTRIAIGGREHTNIFRAIEYPENNKPKFFSFLGCNPARRQNRVNKEGQLIFYGSTSPGAPFSELNAQIGSFYVISTWCNLRKLRLTSLGFSLSNFDRNEVVRNMPKFTDYSWMKKNSIYDYDSELLMHNIIADDFCQNITDGNKSLYNLTNAYAAVLGNENKTDGFIYPSIASKLEGDNVALYEKALQDLKFIDVFWVEIVEFNKKEYRMKIHDFANNINADDTIAWKGRAPSIAFQADSSVQFFNDNLFDNDGNNKYPLS